MCCQSLINSLVHRSDIHGGLMYLFENDSVQGPTHLLQHMWLNTYRLKPYKEILTKHCRFLPLHIRNLPSYETLKCNNVLDTFVGWKTYQWVSCSKELRQPQLPATKKMHKMMAWTLFNGTNTPHTHCVLLLQINMLQLTEFIKKRKKVHKHLCQKTTMFSR